MLTVPGCPAESSSAEVGASVLAPAALGKGKRRISGRASTSVVPTNPEKSAPSRREPPEGRCPYGSHELAICPFNKKLSSRAESRDVLLPPINVSASAFARAATERAESGFRKGKNSSWRVTSSNSNSTAEAVPSCASLASLHFLITLLAVAQGQADADGHESNRRSE